MSNPVIFVSLGPGEPDLITLKGLTGCCKRILCDV